MSATIRTIEYFYTTVLDRPGQAYSLLERLARSEVNLLALSAIPVGPEHTQFALFPERADRLARVAENLGLVLTGPYKALLVRGDDALGALVDYHRRLGEAGVNVFAANGVTDGKGGYGYVMYLRPEDHNEALRVLDAA